MNYLLLIMALILGYLLIKSFQPVQETPLSDTTKEREIFSKEESFSLNIGALEHERITESLQKYNLQQYLKEAWEIEVKENENRSLIIYRLQQLWSEGTVTTFMKNNFLKKELEVKDLIAFDTARFTELLCQLLFLELIEEQEAWGLLFLNAQRVQESFKDAEDFTSSYFKGALFYEIVFKTEEQERGKKIEAFDTLYKAQKEMSKVTIEWLEEPLFNQFKINEMEN